MRGRIGTLCNISTNRMWVGTFHGLANRMLRLHHEQAGLPPHFSILDSDDQLRLIKRIVKDRNLDDEKWQPKQVQQVYQSTKTKGMRSSAMSVIAIIILI